MNSLKALLLVTLMGASVAAMAEGGGDTVMARSEAATASALAAQHPSQATASTQTPSAGDAARSH